MADLLKQAFIGVIGVYTPNTYTTYIDGEAVEVIPAGLAGVDWAWICAAGLVVLAVYIIFRTIAKVISK